jgi:hypothetical protein
MIWYGMIHYYLVDRNKEVLVKIIINFTQWYAYKKFQNLIEIVLVCRYLHILELMPLQHTPGILKSLVAVSVLALAITLERSDVSRGEEQFSNIRSSLYRHLLLGEKSLNMYYLLLTTSVMPIEISMESLLIGYVNCRYFHIYTIIYDFLNFIF